MKKLMMVLAVSGIFLVGCSNQDKTEDAEKERMIQLNDSISEVLEEKANEIKELEGELDEALQKLEDKVEEKVEKNDENKEN